jgi:hypothetical protein
LDNTGRRIQMRLASIPKEELAINIEERKLSEKGN